MSEAIVSTSTKQHNAFHDYGHCLHQVELWTKLAAAQKKIIEECEDLLTRLKEHESKPEVKQEPKAPTLVPKQVEVIPLSSEAF